VGRVGCDAFEAPAPCESEPGCAADWSAVEDCWCDPCDCDQGDWCDDCDWPEEDCGGCDPPCDCWGGEGIAPMPLCVEDETRCGSILDPEACERVAGCVPRWQQPPACDPEEHCPAVLLFTHCDPAD